MKNTQLVCTTAFLALCLSAQSQAAPLAQDDTIMIPLPQFAAFTFNNLGDNDSGFDDSLVTPIGPTPTTRGGSVRRLFPSDPTGAIYQYTVPPNTSGVDSFTYKLTDDQGASDSARVNIFFIEGKRPQARPDRFTAVSGVKTRFSINANDDINNLYVRKPNVANPWSLKGGKVAFDVEDNIDLLIYTPKPGFTGEDKIWYTISNFRGSSWSVVTINVVANSNNSPAAGLLDVATTPRGVQKTIDVLSNDIGSGLVLNTPNSWSLRGGRVSLVNNKLVYKPDYRFMGQDKFWYSFKDAQGRAGWGEVRVDVKKDSNPPYPFGRPDTANATSGQVTTINVLDNDLGSKLRLKLPSAYSSKGGLIFSSLGRLYYRPKSGFLGTDRVWYILRDDAGRENWSNVTINVTP